MIVEKSKLEAAFERDFTSSADNWKANCPIHDERTPSFFVSKEEGLANCFGCGISGYVETILASYKGIAVEKAKYLLDIDTSQRITQKIFNAKGLEIPAPVYFPESWLAPYKNSVHPYILDRLIQTGIEKDAAIAILKSTGTRFDTVTGRQVFPHRDLGGKLLGAVGRTVINQDPRWYVYWDYPRGENIYRPWGEGSSELFLVEGVMDLLKLKALGLDEQYDLGSTQGTKFGRGQVQQIKQYDKVVISFDADKAGYEAAHKLHKKLGKSAKTMFTKMPVYAKDFMDINSKEAALEAASKHYTYVQWTTL